MVDLEGDEFAEFVLSQPPTEDEKGSDSGTGVNSVSFSNPGNRKKGKGGKLSYAQFMVIGTLAFCGFLGQATALSSNETQAKPVYAEFLMVCGSAAVARPSIHPLNHRYTCQTAPTSTGRFQPTPVLATVLRENFIEWKTKAYQCLKTKVLVSTQISFFSDIRDKKVSNSMESVSHGECVDMVRSKSCIHGSLSGSNGVYTTSNEADISYKYCCKWHEFPVSQCSYIEASVYKKFGENSFRSSAGDVSHCGEYSVGHCTLTDGSMLMWDVERESLCQYQEWYKVEGKFLDGHFVSSKDDLALTFNENGLNTRSTCNHSKVSLSDQGLVVKFNTTNLNSSLIVEGVNASVAGTIKAGSAYRELLSQISGMIQPLAMDLAEVQLKLYWSSYKYTCNNMVQVLKTISILAEQHPTMTARFLMGTSHVRAEAGPGFLQVFPCTPITNFTLLPMSEDNCTALIPVNLTVSGVTQSGFLDPSDNVVHRQSMFVPCKDTPVIPLQIKGALQWYHQNGSLELISEAESLDIPGISLGAHPLNIHETTYNLAYHLNWQSFSTHSDLNDVLATLSRQKQVLEAMGIQSGPHETLEKNVVESKENLIGGAWMAFLTGGHVSSVFELWTLACNCITSLIAVIILGAVLYRRCCTTRISRPIIAAVDLESQCTEPDADQSMGEFSDCEEGGEEGENLRLVESGDPESGAGAARFVDHAEQTSFTDFPNMVTKELGDRSKPSAPPAYSPLYPSLQ
jgi:hypothetical protein